ncbi:MAG: ROK family protein [Phycisphaera sp.]|nr:ROK family protein [Phycisphaera sp.]
MTRFVGLDLGGTNIKAGVVNETGRVLARCSVPTRAQLGVTHVVESLEKAARDVAQAAKIEWSSITGIGVGSPGLIDARAGVVKASPNMPAFKQVPLRDLLHKKLNVPTFLANDANAAAFGEFWAGAGKDPHVRSLVMLTLGTGVGGGIVMDGRVVHGSHGLAGELGHLIVERGGRPCPCGQRGCLERYASANAVSLSAVKLLSEGDVTSSLKSLDSEPSAEQVFEAARQGDALACQVVDQAAHYLGLACLNIARAIDPQMIVMAGGMAMAGDFLFERVRRAATKEWWSIEPFDLPIVPAALGNDAGIIGAAAVAWSATTPQTSA